MSSLKELRWGKEPAPVAEAGKRLAAALRSATPRVSTQVEDLNGNAEVPLDRPLDLPRGRPRCRVDCCLGCNGSTARVKPR